MKKLYSILVLLLLAVTVWAQSPQKMSYQAVVRNNDNSLVINRSVGLKISILQGTENVNTVYSELFNPNPETNANGLLTLEIGGGIPVSGTFSEIDWSKGPFFIRTEIDPSGGSNYTVTGTTSLLSVPFALHAHSVGNDKVDDADSDPANEIQQLNLSGTTLSLSKGGGSVTLPASGEGSSDNWGTQSVVSDATLDGAGTSASPLKLADNAITSAKIADGAVTGSKIESGSISADKIVNGAVTGTKIAQSGASSGQVLKWDGAKWSPGEDESGEGGFSLPFEGSVSTANTAFTIHNTHATGVGIIGAGERIGVLGGGVSIGIEGDAAGPSGKGVFGRAPSLTGESYGVYGEASSVWGKGVFGHASNSEGPTVGIMGLTESSEGLGVYGVARNNNGGYGVYGKSDGSKGLGVVGEATSTTGLTYGVSGISKSSEGIGISGFVSSTAGTTYGVRGISLSSEGTGVYGSGKAAGIHGKSEAGTGVYGKSDTGTGVLGESRDYGVYGKSFGLAGAGVYGLASSGTGENYGIHGESDSNVGAGVFGTSTNYGVYGKGKYGIYGESNRTGGAGVYGRTTNTTGSNYGVYGESESSDGKGIYGYATNTSGTTRGVLGVSKSSSGVGVYGQAVALVGNTFGVVGISESSSGRGVYGRVSGSSAFSGYFTGGKFYVDGHVGLGTESPAATLHISHTNGTAGLMPNQGLRIQNTSATNRFWTLYTFSSNGALALYSGTGDGVSVGNFNAGTGAYTATSNRHLKTNISQLGSDILEKIALLKPSRYSYIRDPLNQMTIGFMAEDVQPLFPELVDAVGENSENMAINYAGFSVVAIKAIQQQQKQMEVLQTENEQLKKRLDRLENLVASTAQNGND